MSCGSETVVEAMSQYVQAEASRTYSSLLLLATVRSMKSPVAVEFSNRELALMMEACRSQASCYARDADHERQAFVRQALHAGAVELERLAERLRTIIDRNGRARAEDVAPAGERRPAERTSAARPDPERLPSNVRPIRPTRRLPNEKPENPAT